MAARPAGVAGPATGSPTTGGPGPGQGSGSDPGSDPGPDSGDGTGTGTGGGGGDGNEASPEPGGGSRFTFPSAITVLAVVTVAVWIAAFFIPSGEYRRNDAGNPIEGTYHRIPSPEGFWTRLGDLLTSPVNGLYGVQDPSGGRVSPDASGALYGSAGVFFFVLAIGAFITVVFATGALDRGIGRLAHRLRTRGELLIIGVMVVFALLGSVEGWSEETLGFYGLIVPLMLALGFDRLVASAAILLSSGIGILAATVDPFSIGVASSAAGISMGDGIVLRAIMFVVLTGVTIAYVLRYARRVRADPGRSRSGFLPGDKDVDAARTPEPARLTGRQTTVLVVLVATFALMIFSVIPWASALTGDPEAVPYAWELGWSFPELAALFLIAAVLVAFVGRLGEQNFSATLTRGMGEFIAPALVVVLARGITVIMNNAKITDTVLNAVQGVVSGTDSALFTILVWVVNLPLAFLIPSTSGHATLTMPILAPLAQFAEVPRSLVVTAWATSNGIMNMCIPTSAVLMGGLALAKVGYNTYIRFIAPLLGIIALLVCCFLALGTVIS
ncbi:YfcC family protein [Streptomyces iconiensis]